MQRSIIIGLLTSLLSTSACTKNENVKGAYPPATPKTVEGGAVGAVAGVAIAGITKPTAHNATLYGGLAGAMLGMAVGSYYDQEGAIRVLQRQGVTVIRLGDIVEINIPADILFDGGEAELEYRAYPLMAEITAYLQQYGPVGIAVEGYSDDIGNTFDRIRRSELQAQSVATYLWTHGVNLHRLHYVGMGNTVTVAQERTSLGSAYNRRVTITLWRDEAPSPFKAYEKLKREDCWTRDDPDNC